MKKYILLILMIPFVLFAADKKPAVVEGTKYDLKGGITVIEGTVDKKDIKSSTVIQIVIKTAEGTIKNVNFGKNFIKNGKALKSANEINTGEQIVIYTEGGVTKYYLGSDVGKMKAKVKKLTKVK